MKPEVVRTRAGALAVRDAESGELMHPGVGPLAEAEALYVRQAGLTLRLDRPLVLFDVGLGAGSNALAARAASEGRVEGARLEIVSFERDLSAFRLALAEGAPFGFEGEAGEAGRALLAHGHHQGERTTWRLVLGELPDTLAGQPLADVVFWDPFSARANPTLWTVAAFRAMRAAAGPTCTLYTYSASTATRAALLLAGWAVGTGEGTGNKRETTAAAVRVEDLARPLTARWLTRLELPDAPWPADAPADARARVAAAPQFTAPTS
jgi:queuine tRNA-ribosyltransferase